MTGRRNFPAVVEPGLFNTEFLHAGGWRIGMYIEDRGSAFFLQDFQDILVFHLFKGREVIFLSSIELPGAPSKNPLLLVSSSLSEVHAESVLHYHFYL